MRENVSIQNQVFNEALCKEPLISVSSHGYYGYQPLRLQNSSEPMQTEELNRTSRDNIERMQCEQPVHPYRKRAADFDEPCAKRACKRNPQTDFMKITSQPKCTHKTALEEELLREIHGCSYYHWISSNI